MFWFGFCLYLLDGYLPSVAEFIIMGFAFTIPVLSVFIYEFPVDINLGLFNLPGSKSSVEAVTSCSR